MCEGGWRHPIPETALLRLLWKRKQFTSYHLLKQAILFQYGKPGKFSPDDELAADASDRLSIASLRVSLLRVVSCSLCDSLSKVHSDVLCAMAFGTPPS